MTGNLVIDPIQTADSGSRLEAGFNALDQDGNPTGRTRAFYSDRHVQALLTAMERKNYGRVLAKPKVLVDDGRKGQIVTTDTTTYVKESIQIPADGHPDHHAGVRSHRGEHRAGDHAPHQRGQHPAAGGASCRATTSAAVRLSGLRRTRPPAK